MGNTGFDGQEYPQFRKSIECILPQLSELTLRLLKCLAIALGLEENYFVERHKHMCAEDKQNPTTFRTLFYPSLSASDTLEAGVQRCGEHSDYGTVTLLFQDDMGDLMQFWTADYYTATVHRVRVPEEEVRRCAPRQSLAFFVHPDNEVMVSPLDGSSKYPTVSALDHL